MASPFLFGLSPYGPHQYAGVAAPLSPTPVLEKTNQRSHVPSGIAQATLVSRVLSPLLRECGVKEREVFVVGDVKKVGK